MRRPAWFAVLVVVSLALGIYFRLANLDRKVYWNDEVWTSLWISGHSLEEMERGIVTNQVVAADELLRFQRVNPGRGVGRTVAILAREDAKQPALYLVLARAWAGLAGDSPARIRLLSALLGLLAFPALYWLCRELFDAPAVAWTALLLLAVSPFHVLYAQEARPYSLWTLLTIASSAALLRARRLNSPAGWGAYALTVAAGLYSQTLFAFVLVAQAASVALTPAGQAAPRPDAGRGLSGQAAPRRLSWRAPFPPGYLVALAAGLLLFLPWAFFIVAGREQLKGNSGWVMRTAGFSELLNRWMLGFGSILVDPGGNQDASLGPGAYGPALIALPALILMVVALVFLARHGPRRARALLFGLIVAFCGPFMIPDLVAGGTRLSTTRFLTPALLGILIATAFLLASKVLGPGRGARRLLWPALLVAVVAAGAVSLGRSSRAETWWNKYFGGTAPPAAQAINQSPRPLVVCAGWGLDLRRLITLAYKLDPRARFLLVRGPGPVAVPTGFGDVFWLGTEPQMRKILVHSGFRLEPVRREAALWRLRR